MVLAPLSLYRVGLFFLEDFEKIAVSSSPDWRVSLEKLKSSKKTPAELEHLPPQLRRYYKQQNLLLGEYERMEELSSSSENHQPRAGEAGEKHARLIKVAIYVSMLANIVLFALNVYNAIRSKSYAVFAAAVDSFLDLLAGTVIWLTAIITKRASRHQFPSGKSRFEPLAMIIISSVMAAATLQIFVQALQDIVANARTRHPLAPAIDWFTLLLIGVSVGTKLVLWLFCRSIPGSISAHALAVDHRNDVIVNTSGTAFAILAWKVRRVWWLDPTGAVIIALYILLNWGRNGWEQVGMLSGRSASPQFLNVVTYLSWNHDPRIKQIDTVRAFHLAERFIVEVDIVLPEDMPLCQAHDIGESLQFRLEELDEVERAFVHLDYETGHKPEH